MTKFYLSIFLISAVSTPALADPTHIAAQGGHSHWLGLAAIGLAGVVIAGALKARRPATKTQNNASDKA